MNDQGRFNRLTERGGVVTGVPDELAAARAAELLRLLQAPPPRLPATVRARIVARLEAEGFPAAGQRRLLWPAAGAATLVLFAGGAVGATWGMGPAEKLFGRWMRSERQPAQVVASGKKVAAVTTAPRNHDDALADERPVSAALAAPKTLATTVIEPEASRPLALEAPRRHKAPSAVSVGVTVTDLPADATAHKGAALPHPSEEPGASDDSQDSQNSIVAESRLLANALTLLRQRREPARALRALDDYERLFPSGALAPEASAARIDALLELGRRKQALERLDTLALDSLPRAAELRVLRGELRAGGGALAGAVSDFGAVLGMTGAPAPVIERALYGRGTCRARLGDSAGARADLRDYLRRFPRGQFAGPAGRALRD